MKNFILLLLFVTGIASSQIVNIPDANFKAKLLAALPSNTIAYSNGAAIKIDANNDNEIQILEAQAIDSLDINTSNISDLEGIVAFSNLKKLNCSHNVLPILNVSGLVQLIDLDCGFNAITALNISGLNQLKKLICYVNMLNDLNVLGFNQLTLLYCSNNNLTSLNVSGLNQLQRFACDSNQLTTLNLSGLSNIVFLHCESNQFTELDFSDLIHLKNLYCSENFNLSSLNLKNGSNENWDYVSIFSGNNNLTYVCADEFRVDQLHGFIISSTMTPNCQVSSYCSFTPGGNYNTITGGQLFDSNNNGCDATDLPFSNIKIKINDGTTESHTFTNPTGNYKFYTQAGSYTLTPDMENTSFFNFSPATAVVNFPDNNNNISTNNFCITANGVHPDLEVVIAPITPARPGFTATYRMVYKNKGNQTQSGNIVFGYNQAVLSLVSSVPNYTTIPSAGFYNYEFSNLMPFESRTIFITFHVNAPTDTPAVNIGDVLDFNAYLNSGSDEMPADNAFIYHQTVVGSFDPNDITCIEGNVVPPTEIGKYLHYVINFENIGTAVAQNVVVKTTIDPAKFDVSSLQLLQTSHLVDARINGNVAEFIFNNIYLDTNGHGNVLLKIKSKNTLISGNSVSNKADVYFDYNAPVATNIETTIFQLLGINEFELDESVSIFPNPATSIINVNCNNSINSVELFDIQGRILNTKTVNDAQVSLDISQYANGIYFVKVLTDKGIKIEKVIKK